MPKTDNTTNRVKFTSERVGDHECPPDKSEAKIWDTEVKSLTLRARPSGKKAYFFQGRLNDKMIRIKIDDVTKNGITHEEARDIALEYQVLVRQKKDPRLEIRRKVRLENTERLELEKKGVRVEQVIVGYIDANRSEWGESHLNDYLKSIQITKRGRNGILYDLKDLKIEGFTASRLLNWLKLEKRHRPTAAAKGYRLLLQL